MRLFFAGLFLFKLAAPAKRAAGPDCYCKFGSVLTEMIDRVCGTGRYGYGQVPKAFLTKITVNQPLEDVAEVLCYRCFIRMKSDAVFENMVKRDQNGNVLCNLDMDRQSHRLYRSLQLVNRETQTIRDNMVFEARIRRGDSIAIRKHGGAKSALFDKICSGRFEGLDMSFKLSVEHKEVVRKILMLEDDRERERCLSVFIKDRDSPWLERLGDGTRKTRAGPDSSTADASPVCRKIEDEEPSKTADRDTSSDAYPELGAYYEPAAGKPAQNSTPVGGQSMVKIVFLVLLAASFSMALGVFVFYGRKYYRNKTGCGLFGLF